MITITKTARNEIYKIAAFLDNCWRAEYSKIVSPDFLGEMSVDERYEMLLNRFDGNISDFFATRDDGG
ncbi:MAG: hypothetical protein LBS74_06865 [Oscillospiraceae bacterium]|jgi:hypothetical protein|nr:hypothetical protein [Oscillospiraceae bacterium]